MNETLQRALSGAVYILLLLSAVLYSTESFFVLFYFFLLIAVFEFSKLVRIHSLVPTLLASLIYGSSAYMLVYKVNIQYVDIVVLGITLFVSLISMIFLFDNKHTELRRVSKYIFLIGYIILPFISIMNITALGEEDPNSVYLLKTYKPKILISVFILIWTNDTFAYIVGKSIGRNKLFERISPKKTIEGFLGGLFFSLLAAFLISKFYMQPKPIHFQKSLIIWGITAVLISVFGTIGDLIESKFKRIAGVKDSGNIMPGHGGILDRLDSIIFVAPFIFLLYKILPK
mgnify:CR=1 FL=1